MAAAVAGIALPEGEPRAAFDAAASIGKLAGGFEQVAASFRRAAGATPSWSGVAAGAAQASLETSAQAADASREACVSARAEVVRYAADLEQAHEQVKRLQEEAEQVEADLQHARREAEAAAGRAEEAHGRAAVAMLAAPLDGGGAAMVAHEAALSDAHAAEEEQAAWTRRANRLQEQLQELRERAARERERAREAEDRAEGAVVVAQAQFPAVPAGAGLSAVPVVAGQPASPFAGPLLPGGLLFGRPLQPRPGEGEEDDGDGGPLDFVDDAWDATAGARHATGNFTSGLTNELSFGAVDLGGDKDSSAYSTGQGASYVPWNPASAVKSLGTGAVKLGGKVLGKEATEEGGEAAAKRNIDELGSGRGGGGSRGASDGVPIPPPRRWGPHNGPGPLGREYAETFRSASYTERVLDQDQYLYRAWGGNSGEMSRFWSVDPPAGPLQAKLDSALPPGNTAENLTEIRVPAGTKVYEGSVAPNFGRPGGGSQVVLDGRVPSEWVTRTENGYANGP